MCLCTYIDNVPFFAKPMDVPMLDSPLVWIFVGLEKWSVNPKIFFFFLRGGNFPWNHWSFSFYVQELTIFREFNDFFIVFTSKFTIFPWNHWFFFVQQITISPFLLWFFFPQPFSRLFLLFHDFFHSFSYSSEIFLFLKLFTIPCLFTKKK